MILTTELKRQINLTSSMGLAEISRQGFLTSEMWIEITGARYSLHSKNEARICLTCKGERHRTIEFVILSCGLRDTTCVHCRDDYGRPWKKIRMAQRRGQ